MDAGVSDRRRGRTSLKPWIAAPGAGRIAFGLITLTLLVVLTTAAKGMFGNDAKAGAPKTAAAAAKDDAPPKSAETPRTGESPLLSEAPDAALGAKAAGERAPSSRAKTRPAPAEVPSAASTVLTMGGVCALVAAGVWLLARFLRKARLAPSGERSLRLCDVLPLGQKRFVYVVGFRDRTLVLAAGGDDVNLLVEYSADELAAETAAAPAETSAPAPATRAPAEVPAVTSPSISALIDDSHDVDLDIGEDGDAVEPPPPPPRRAPLIPASAAVARAKDAAAAATRAKEIVAAAPRVKEAAAASRGRDAATARASGDLPPGAHRVPPAFRHLLKRTLKDEASS